MDSDVDRDYGIARLLVHTAGKLARNSNSVTSSAIHFMFENQFENMVLRRIFGPERDEVTGEWRKLHNEERNYM